MSRTISFLQALNEAMAEEMRRDGIVLARMSSLGLWANHGIDKEFGPKGVNTPIAENAIRVAMGTASMASYRS
jgi:pyruvate/2-oxoglutarate/acetoin dehydrogenase E1 component